jgi:hypothetical protein
LDRHQLDAPLQATDDHPRVVDFLVSQCGFARLQSQGEALVFDGIKQ